ncbi:hypothetical protein JCM19052_505 [Vibrio sp. JCM 19052]|nr:hypothetical protein JCM19052_505 [Vibrio sp. JCM 19052]
MNIMLIISFSDEKIITKVKSNFYVNKQIYKNKINGIKGVFFSNVFDGKKFNFGNDISDLSLSKRKLDNFKEQYEFINDYGYNSKSIEIPNALEVELLKVKRISKNNKFKDIDITLVHKNQLRIERQILKLDYIKRLENHIMYHLTFDTLRLIKKNSERCIANVLDILEKKLDIEVKLLELSQVILNHLEDEIFYSTFELNNYESRDTARKEDNSIKILLEREAKLIEFSDRTKHGSSLLQYTKFNPLSNEISDAGFMEILISDIRDKNVYDLLSFSDFGSIGIRWKGISSGHKAFLNLYASIYNEIKYTKRTTLICIDEGDLYFHPKWQISFFSELLSIISKFNSDKVQIVITSHSPFILTEIPNQNVMLLENNCGITTIRDSDFKTFGSELYGLYSNGFFLDDVKVGNFSQEKITGLINRLSQSDYVLSIEDKQLIEIIGNDLLQIQIARILKGRITND